MTTKELAHFMVNLVKSIRQSIIDSEFDQLKKEWLDGK